MKKNLILAIALMLVMSFSGLFAQTWAEIPDPKIISVEVSKENPAVVIITFEAQTPIRQDKLNVKITSNCGGNTLTRTMGRTKSNIKMIEFEPGVSGNYTFSVEAYRTTEKTRKGPVSKSFDFVFPLGTPAINLLNNGNGTLLVSWDPVKESEGYEVVYTDSATGKEVAMPRTNMCSTEIKGLTVGGKTAVKVASIRGNEKNYCNPVTKTIIAGKDRVWKFTYFGQSTKADYNTMEMLDADNLKFKLNSCSYNPDNQTIMEKGGKFTAFHDGISFYYTEIDSATENFELTATFTVDYINITADGQEGFGILCLDSLGKQGVNMTNHYTNSASILATKMEERFGEVKKTSKDTLGVRFTTGITPEVIAKGDAGIAEFGKSEIHAFSYDSSDIVRAGDVYRITLKKDNTGYHAIYDREIVSEDTITKFTMYDSSKLLQLNKEKVYLGFAVARGCNVTVSDVDLKITDPRTDPPGIPEPPEMVPLTLKVDSPATYGTKKYPFVFNANADGKLTVTDPLGKIVIKDEYVKAFEDYKKELKLVKGFNDFVVTFKPDDDYVPGEKMAIAKYDKELRQYVESHDAQSITHTVVYVVYEGKQLYVSPNGNALNKGTKESPLDLLTAVNYALPGQPVIMLEGTYYPTNGLNIERGNSGTPKKRKILQAAPGTRPIIDLSGSKLGITLWGDYWLFKGFDVRRSQGNVKAIQVGGHHNILERIDSYENGDTGIQVSGMSIEGPERWPRHNLILNCTSWGNCDPAANNADGFGAKLTTGVGNKFIGCIAHHNIDDGWDLYSKIESGPIGVVVIENCIAYGNGHMPDGSGNGDGNGFKLGGDGIAVAHELRNSFAFGNGTSGITSNSDPAIVLINNTAYGNDLRNISLYGKGKGTPRMFKTHNNISMNGGGGDEIKEMPELADADDYFWNGAQSINSEGVELKADIFKSVDYKNIVPTRNPDGSINMNGLFELTDKAPKAVGADMNRLEK